MRILDCKSPVCSKIAENAPKIVDYLCEECENHFAQVKKYLDLGDNYPTAMKKALKIKED